MSGQEQTEQFTKKRTKTKGWSTARRAAQRARCLAAKPWEHSTGPRTSEGKAVISRNALRHGLYDADYLTISRTLWMHQNFLSRILNQSGISRVTKQAHRVKNTQTHPRDQT